MTEKTLKMARALKIRCPGLNVIFATGYDDYMRDAFSLRVSGYVKKPITAEDVRVEKNKKRVPVDLEFSGDLYTPHLSATATALHGKCQLLASNLRVLYTPETDYEGEDIITVEFTSKFGEKFSCAVNVTVGDPSAETSTPAEDLSAEQSAPALDGQPSEFPLGVALALAAGAVAAITAAALYLRKKRKK